MPFALPIAFFLIGFLWSISPLPRGFSKGKTRPRIAVIIPARNEAQRITPLLTSLAQQTLTPDEIVVVDDDSVDETPTIARKWGARLISAGPRPDGWNGKTWACWRGVEETTADLLIFLDADTWLSPTGLEALVDTYLQKSGLVSVQPYHVTKCFYEQFAAFFNLVVVMSLTMLTPFKRSLKAGGAFGPCMVCSRLDYLRVGGHSAVRQETLEDIPLGRLFAQAGLPVHLFTGTGAVYFRMYPEGLRQLIEGYSKGMAYGALAVHPLLAFLAGTWITGCFSTSVGLARRMIATPFSPETLFYGALYIAYAIQIHWLLRRIGRFQPWVAPLFVIPLAFFGFIVLISLILTFLLGQVRWKGRTIPTGWRKRHPR